MSNYIPNEHDAAPQKQPEEQQLELEAALQRALRHVEAPEGFAARMRALAEAEQRTAAVQVAAERSPWWRLRFGWKPAWGAAAAVVVAGVLCAHVVHDRHVEEDMREQRARASEQFNVSQQITDRALEHTRDQLRRAGVALDEEGNQR